MNACRSVGTDGLGESGAAGDPADDPPGAVPVQPPPVRCEEDRPVTAFVDGEVDRAGSVWCERDGDDLAALAGDDEGPVPALPSQVLDVRAGGLGDPEPIQGEQRDQRVLKWRSEPRGD
jgi:hypothetical protein